MAESSEPGLLTKLGERVDPKQAGIVLVAVAPWVFTIPSVGNVPVTIWLLATIISLCAIAALVYVSTNPPDKAVQETRNILDEIGPRDPSDNARKELASVLKHTEGKGSSSARTKKTSSQQKKRFLRSSKKVR